VLSNGTRLSRSDPDHVGNRVDEDLGVIE
jgi:hypothetical protein